MSDRIDDSQAQAERTVQVIPAQQGWCLLVDYTAQWVHHPVQAFVYVNDGGITNLLPVYDGFIGEIGNALHFHFPDYVEPPFVPSAEAIRTWREAYKTRPLPKEWKVASTADLLAGVGARDDSPVS